MSRHTSQTNNKTRTGASKVGSFSETAVDFRSSPTDLERRLETKTFVQRRLSIAEKEAHLENEPERARLAGIDAQMVPSSGL